MAGYLASHGEATAVEAASFPFAATANSPNENKNNQSRRPSRPRPGQRQSTGLDNCSFTARPLSPVLVGTRTRLDAINAIFLRAASEEVACHPDDANAVRQTHSRLNRLPPTILTGG
jgi:hypothetical protein